MSLKHINVSRMDYEHKKGQTEEWIISTKKDRQKNELSAQKRKTETATELGRKSRAETEMEQNDSNDIPSRGESFDIPGLPFGE